MFDELTDYLKQHRAAVDTHLADVVHRLESWPGSLRAAVEHSLLAPGKRLRPLLVLLAAEAAGGSADAALHAAGAVEMVHTYSLIHDDLPAMDDDDLRRGLPTCHKRFGEALAILAGDALLTLAFEVVADNYPPGVAARCCRELAAGAGGGGMVGGQVLDLTADGRIGEADLDATAPQAARERLQEIHARKTGALFRACLRIGGHLAEGTPSVLAALDSYGQCFGHMFQITDDLLDVESTPEQTGKGVQKDAARGKLTYPGFLGVAESKGLAAHLCTEAEANLHPLGQAGHRLTLLARYVLVRDR